MTTPLATLLPQLAPTTFPVLALDAAGTTHLFVSVACAVDECWPAPDGTWTSTSILSGAILSGLYNLALQMVGTEGAWLFASSGPPGSGGDLNLTAMQKAGGVWQTPQVIYAMPPPSSPSCCGTALSPDGTRCAALVGDLSAGFLILMQSGSTWIPTPSPRPTIRLWGSGSTAPTSFTSWS